MISFETEDFALELGGHTQRSFVTPEEVTNVVNRVIWPDYGIPHRD